MDTIYLDIDSQYRNRLQFPNPYDFTINYSDESTQNYIACDSYQWNNEVYTQSGTYTYETQTINGCDSVSIINLTINN